MDFSERSRLQEFTVRCEGRERAQAMAHAQNRRCQEVPCQHWTHGRQAGQVDFGEVFIPSNLDVPKPRVLPEFKRLAHGLRSSNISVLDAKTFYM